jgi:ribonuclease HII
MATAPLNRDREPSCLAGVDEAGLGPILGPLVVAGTAFVGPRGVDPWQALAETVTREAPSHGQIRVADSKKVNQGPHGHARLEQAALCFWGALHGELPPTLRDLLVATGNDPARLATCPWYGDLSLPLPAFNDRDELELRSHLLARALGRHAIEVLHLDARVVEVEEFNASIAGTDNKGHTHLDAYASVIRALLRRIPAGAHLVADRCGGRIHYRTSLGEAWPGARVRTLREGDELSAYRIEAEAGTFRVTFAVQGEDRSFPTALASCLAKYLRELLISVLNAWFQARVPELVPTAGYYTDGKRFLRDIDELVRRDGLPLDRLVRVR